MSDLSDDEEGSKPHQANVVSLNPYEYIHILNRNTNTESLVIGPRNYVCSEHEKLSSGPDKMIAMAPMEYCVIKNPVVRDADKKVVIFQNGETKVSMGDREFRFHQDPFPLYPGEVLEDKIIPLPVVKTNQVLRLRSKMAFIEDGINRSPGDEWTFDGPGVYHPRKEVEILPVVDAFMIEPTKALRMSAAQDCVDRTGVQRKSGDEWLVKTPGAYLPTAYETCVAVVSPYQLNEKIALHVKSLREHTDVFGKQRKFGDEWLVTWQDAESYMCEIEEQTMNLVQVKTLNAQQYCVIVDPVNKDGVPQLGAKKLVRGETSFFLQPGEYLDKGIELALNLRPDQAVVCLADERVETDGVVHEPGTRWIVQGPCEFIRPIGVTVLEQRCLIPLGECEGVYVQNIKTGLVRSVIGQSYMVKADEQLWSKPISEQVRALLAEDDPVESFRRLLIAVRNRNAVLTTTKSIPMQEADEYCAVVTLQVPHKAAIQVYDFAKNSVRVEFGPTLIMLEPEEEVRVMSLSGSKPKQPNRIKALYLLLGPDYCTDDVVVETADHARLSIRLAYNWHFDVKPSDPAEETVKIFAVPDFVGDLCKTMASRIRSAVAVTTFDKFHKNSARIIRAACLGLDSAGKVCKQTSFSANHLVITAVDIQSVEPVDEYTKISLQKSVKLAIEITTKSQEAEARYEAERIEQEAKGRLERQKIDDQAAVEKSRKQLIESQLAAKLLECTGKAKSRALAETEKDAIISKAKLTKATSVAQKDKIMLEAKMKSQEELNAVKLSHRKLCDELELKNREDISKLQISRFQRMVKAVGSDTLSAMATSGSSHEIKMLQALGLKSTLITDGSTPVNLVTTAGGLIGQEQLRNHAITAATGQQ